MRRLSVLALLAVLACEPGAAVERSPARSQDSTRYVWYGPATIATMKEQLSRLPDGSKWMQFDSAGHRWNRLLPAPSFQPSSEFPAFEESTYCPPFCLTANAR